MGLFSGSQIRVAVLRGGQSPDYEESLRTGEHVLAMLRLKPEVYEPMDIFISKDGEWHLGGITREPHKALEYADVVFNALHGSSGEDGKLQSLLSTLRIPYTGSDAFSSSIALNKHLSKKAYMDHSLYTPRYEVITEEDELQKLVDIFRNYLHPVVVKPSSSDLMRGLALCYTFEQLVKAVDEAMEYSKYIIIEEFIRGKEARVGVLEKAREEDLYAFMPQEVRTPYKDKMPDYESKFENPFEYLTKGNFTTEQNKLLEDTAKKAHTALGLRHYSHSDMILTPSGKVYVLETSALPMFSKNSTFDESLKAAGWTAESFIDHVINLALSGVKYN